MKAPSGILTMAIVVMAATAALSAAPYPRVSGLHAFSPDANYMSLPGYFRYLVHRQDGQWLRYAQAARIVHQERGQ